MNEEGKGRLTRSDMVGNLEEERDKTRLRRGNMDLLFHPTVVIRNYRCDLRLLKHDFRNPDLSLYAS